MNSNSTTYLKWQKPFNFDGPMSSSLLAFSGHQHLRHRLVLSLLSGKHVKIDKIRPDDKNPGLRGVPVSSTLNHARLNPCRLRDQSS